MVAVTITTVSELNCVKFSTTLISHVLSERIKAVFSGQMSQSNILTLALFAAACPDRNACCVFSVTAVALVLTALLVDIPSRALTVLVAMATSSNNCDTV